MRKAIMSKFNLSFVPANMQDPFYVAYRPNKNAAHRSAWRDNVQHPVGWKKSAK